jgi:hypothetical protein
MNTESELASLKQEVARLRREMDEYRQFIHYHPPGKDDDDLDCPAYLTIRCSILSVVNPSPPSQSQINIIASRLGPYIALAGKDEKTRILFQLEKDQPEVSLMGDDHQYKASLRLDQGEPAFELYAKEGKLAVQLKAVGEEGHGQVGVCAAGKPRAVMKSTEKGAAISVVHDDGHARVTMVSELDNGHLMAVTPDMQVGVKILANGLDGGLITVNRANGRPGVMLSNTAIGGAVIVQDHAGNITGHLPMIPDGD